MTTPDLAALLKIAEAATPGPWRHEAHRAPGMAERVPARTNEIWSENHLIVAWTGFDSAWGERWEKQHNATHIAAFDPTVAQALVRAAQATKLHLRGFDHPMSAPDALARSAEHVRASLSALTAALKGNPHG